MGLDAERGRTDLRRVRWMILFRMVLLLIGIGVIIIYKPGLGFEDFLYAYIFLIVAMAINLSYLLLLPAVRDVTSFSAVQLGIDVAITTALTYVTGGLESLFAYFYFGFVVFASMLVSPWSSLLYAASATALMASVAAGYFTASRMGIELPLVPRVWLGRAEHGRVTYVLASLLVRGSALHMVAILSGALQSSLNRARIFTHEILDSISEGAVAVDAEKRVVFINPKALEMLSLDGSVMSGRPLAEVVAGLRNPVLSDALRGLGPPYRETIIQNADGLPHPVAVTRTAIRARNGRERGAVLMIIDLSLRARAESAERSAARLQALGQMAAGIAHEIRNPLACIRGAVQELQEELPSDGSGTRLAELVLRESDRLNRIISDFLMFAKAKHGKLGRCDVSQILREVAELLEKRGDGPSVSVRVHSADGLVVLGDAEQLKQVFLNLGLNGVEATRGPARALAMDCEKGTLDSVSGVAVPGGGGIVVRCRDWGIGIEPNDMHNIFDPFFTTKPGGTGLGLCISQAIVHAHGGVIAIQSEPKKGTTATVWLPAYEERTSQVLL